MGQYYRIALKGIKETKFSYLDRTCDGKYTSAKLTEHSWIGNNMTEAVCKKLYNKPTQIAWVGDYADQKALEEVNPDNTEKNNYLEIVEEVWNIDNEDRQPDYFEDKGLKSSKTFTISEKCLVNHNKKLILLGSNYYSKIHNIQAKTFWANYDKIKDKNKTTKEERQNEKLLYYNWEVDSVLHPLPLLTAVGNGRGGGDYAGINADKIGSWAFDVLEVVNYNKAIKLISKKGYKLYNIVFSENI